MSRADEKRLDDIREVCGRSAELVGRGRSALEADDLLWLALERLVEIAGEAATKLTPEMPSAFRVNQLSEIELDQMARPCSQ